MTMRSTVPLAYEGPPACAECQRRGIPLCDHIGFNPDAWPPLIGQAMHVPGLDDAYTHILTGAVISGDRKTITLTVDTHRRPFDDLARHLSVRADVRAKASVRAVHHHTGEVIEAGWYDRFLRPGESVCVDRDLYHVESVDHPARGPHGVVADGGDDVQVARLVPVPVDQVRPAYGMPVPDPSAPDGTGSDGITGGDGGSDAAV